MSLTQAIARRRALFVSVILLACTRNVSAWVASTRMTTTRLNTRPSSFKPSVRLQAAPGSSSETKAVSNGASIPNLTISLVKSIVGGGILALPAGVACLGDTVEVIPMAVLFIAFAGALNAYFFTLLGQVCDWTGATSYREAWDRTVGTRHSQWVALTVTLKTALSCLAYSMILADSFQSLGVAAGFDVTRTTALLGVTLVALLPLCLLRDLTSLAPFSLLGVLGFLFTSGVVVMRSLDGSYQSALVTSGDMSGGRFLADLPLYLQPEFGLVDDTASTMVSLPDAQGVVLLCTLATAFVAHYNAPRFHAELQDNTMDRFRTVVQTAYAVSGVLFAIVAVAGFGTFGSHSQSFLLQNYSPFDPLAAACRAVIAISLVLTFPLPFCGLRDGVLDACQVPASDRTPASLTSVSIGLLAVVTGGALLVKDLGLVLSVGGGTFSTACSSIFPALMFRAAVAQRNDKVLAENDPIQVATQEKINLESSIALVLMSISFVIGIAGVYLALQAALQEV